MSNPERNLHTVFDKLVPRSQKEELLGHKGLAVWFTGLSGSGKTTIGKGLEHRLNQEGVLTTMLDGDNVRTGLNNNLGFSLEDRQENIRRVAETAKLFCNTGVVSIMTFVSPTEEIRKVAKDILGDDMFVIYVNTSLEECERRDVKGLYAKARKGEIKDFTGIGSPFEPPKAADVVIDTEQCSVEEAVEQLVEIVQNKIKNS